jgi:hypothetical protein
MSISYSYSILKPCFCENNNNYDDIEIDNENDELNDIFNNIIEKRYYIDNNDDDYIIYTKIHCKKCINDKINIINLNRKK